MAANQAPAHPPRRTNAEGAHPHKFSPTSAGPSNKFGGGTSFPNPGVTNKTDDVARFKSKRPVFVYRVADYATKHLFGSFSD